MRIKISVFTDSLAGYPPDVVVDGCRAYANENKWWPAWSELVGYLDWRVNKRRRMKEALEKALDTLRAVEERRKDEQ